MSSPKTALITGGTFGIGAETALGMARAGLDVVIVGRDQEKAQRVLKRIAAEAPHSRARFVAADLSHRAGVRAFADTIRGDYARLDVLVNNAGGMFATRSVTADGFERHWGLNHLAYVQIVLEMLPLLKQASGGRIINVASNMYKRGRINFTDLQAEHRYTMLSVYSQSKLANVMTTFVMARGLATSGITVNCLHPGVVDTGLIVNAGGFWQSVLGLARPFILSAADGAKTSIYLATSADVSAVTGHYFIRNKIRTTTAASRDPEMQSRLWAVTLAHLQMDDPFAQS